MFKRICLLSKLLLLSTCLILVGQSLAKETSEAMRSKASFQLYAWPHQVIVHGHQPVNITFALHNVTNHATYIRVWYWPVPFGPRPDLRCLRLRCRNQITGKEVQYKWPPLMKTPSDHLGKELPDLIPPGKSYIFPYDLRQFCVLPPGKYILDLQYDTRYMPPWVKSDRRAWHGVTNKETVRIQVLQ